MADLKSIIQQLTEERDRIDAAIRALQQVEGLTNGHKNTGAVPLTNSSARRARANAPAKKRKRRLSAEARARIASAAKARWAAAKKAGKRSL